MAADDIMAFMTRVKRKLVDDDAQYATFVRALHRWEQQAIGTDELAAHSPYTHHTRERAFARPVVVVPSTGVIWSHGSKYKTV